MAGLVVESPSAVHMHHQPISPGLQVEAKDLSIPIFASDITKFCKQTCCLDHLGIDVIVYRHHKSKVGKRRHQVFVICRLIFRGPVPSALAPLGVMGLTQTPITGILH